MAQCLDCGHNFFNAGQMGDSLTQGSCENCGSQNFASQPSPTQSDMEMRNMPAPGEEDMGGNPLKEGFMEDGGWNNRMKRDETFASYRPTATNWDEEWGVHPQAPKWTPRGYRPGERDPENSPQPTDFDYDGQGGYSAQFGMSEGDRNRALLLNQGLGQQDQTGTSLDRPWQQGEPGKGLIDSSGQVHTWPEDFGTHERFMLNRGMRPGDVPFKFIIGPEGHVSAYNPQDPTNLAVPEHLQHSISEAGLNPGPKGMDFSNADASGLDGLDFLASRQKLYSPWNYEANALDLDFEQTQVIEPGPHTIEIAQGESTPLILQHDDPQLLQDAKSRLEASHRTAAPALIPAAELEVAAAPAEIAGAGAAAGAVGAGADAAAGAAADAAGAAGGAVEGAEGAAGGFLKGLWGKAKGAVGGITPGGVAKSLGVHEAVHAVGNLMNGATGAASSLPAPSEVASPLLSHFLFATDESYDRPGSDDKLTERADGDPQDVDGKEFKDGEDKGLFDDTNQAGGAHSPAMLDDSILDRIDSLLPLLLHYYHGGEGGADDPLVQALDGELEAAHPGYKGQDKGDPRIIGFWGDLNNMLPKHDKHQHADEDGFEKESEPQDDLDDGDDARHAAFHTADIGVTCPSCGSMDYDHGHCGDCGYDDDHDGPADDPEETPKKESGVLPQLTQMGQQPTMTPASTPGPTPAPNMSYCPYCGGTLSPGQPQCPQCNAAVAGGTPGVAPQPRQARWTLTAGPAPVDPSQDPSAAGAPPGGDPSQMGMMAPPPPPPPPGSEGNQGPSTREQFQAVADLLQQEGRQDEITTMLANPSQYADELAQVQRRDAPPQIGDDGSTPVPAQEVAPPGDTMPMPNPADNPQPLSRVLAADTLAPKCPKCDGHTTGILDHDKGTCGCKTCGHSWTVDKKVVEAAHGETHDDPSQVQPSAASWADEDGEPLQEGQEYQMYTGGYSVPDLVTIRQIKPDGIVYELMGEHGTHAVTEVTSEEAGLDQLTFVPAFGLDQTQPDPNQMPDQNSDNTGYQGAPEQADLSTPHMTTTSNDHNFMYEQTDVPPGQSLDQWRSDDNPHKCALCGNTAHHGSQLCANCEYQQGLQNTPHQGAVGPDWLRDEVEADQRIAGRNFTQMEQRELIDEPGAARNSDKLDLSNTHYLEDDSLLFW